MNIINKNIIKIVLFIPYRLRTSAALKCIWYLNKSAMSLTLLEEECAFISTQNALEVYFAHFSK